MSIVGDQEIYAYAMEVISNITDDVVSAKYSDPGANLSVRWSEADEFNASAPLPPVVEHPPGHVIVINYALAKQLYRDAENFVKFTEDPRTIEFVNKFPKEYRYHLLLPVEFSRESCIKNIFLASLTWIYFHELAHLNQEHGVVRADGTHLDEPSYADEREDKKKDLTLREALLWHTTELAADAEGTVRCISELHRHFAQGKGGDKFQAEPDLIAASYLLICGLSCVLYRFNGGTLKPAYDYPRGTHPNAIFRLEQIIKKICQALVFIGETHQYEISNREILKLTKQAADLGAYFTYFYLSDRSSDLSELVVRGLYERPEYKRYMQKIISTWDEIAPALKVNTRYPVQAGFLYFSDKYRDYNFGNPPNNEGNKVS
ncbi:hypothetical protein [Pseudomonas sp.]|uniref:hypothetical protein n=1 Tax=Pseudomonas sp. TaxID=306 RepID=UPI003264685D